MKQSADKTQCFCCLDDEIEVYCTAFIAKYFQTLREEVFAGIQFDESEFL